MNINVTEDGLNDEGNNIIERGVLRMLFSHSDAVFFAYFIVRMLMVEEKHPPQSLGMGMSLHSGQFKLTYDLERLKEGGLDDIDSVVWIEGHEVYHHILNHHTREMAYWDGDEAQILKWHSLFNVAQDLEIHEMYKPVGKLATMVCMVGQHADPSKPDEVDPPWANFPTGLTSEEYFDLLRKDIPEPPEQEGASGDSGEPSEGDGKPGDGSGNPTPNKNGRFSAKVQGNTVTVTDNQTGKQYSFKINDNGVPQKGPQEDLDREVLRQALADALKEARPSMGTEPGGLVSIVEKMIQPPRIRWEHRFRQLIGKHVRAGWQSSWKRYSRRLGEGFRGRIKDHGLSIVVVPDTSGSVGDEYLTVFANEIEYMRRVHKVNTVTVIECDAAVQGVTVLTPGQPYTPMFRGRGGTDFRPAFAYVEEQKLKFDMMIWLTDSQGTFPDKRPNYPVIWAVTEEAGCVKIPWGDVVFMDLPTKKD
jgi:predicted metal-dependent peptidase